MKAYKDFTESTRLENKTSERRDKGHHGFPSGKNYSIAQSGNHQRKSTGDFLLPVRSWEKLIGQV